MKIFAIVLTAAAWLSAQDLSFTQQPQMTQVNDSTWRIEFTVSRATDVAVSIVNPADSSVVRRLAGGVLGANPPAPLVKDSLHQVLYWDGRDECRRSVASAAQMRCRVRAGMSPSLAGLADGDLHRFNRIDGMASDTAGGIYVYGSVSTLGMVAIRKYGPDGTYLKTLYPYPGGLDTAEVRQYSVNYWQNSLRYSPKHIYMRFPRFAPAEISQDYSYNYPAHVNAGLASDVALDRLFVVSDNLKCMIIKGNGGLSGVSNPIPLVTAPQAGPAGADYSIRFTQDGKTAYLTVGATGAFWGLNRIYRVDVLTGVATVMAQKASGSFSGLALDGQGHVFACEPLEGRVAIYDTSGALQSAITVANPYRVEASRETGAVYVITRTTAAVSVHKYAGAGGDNTAPLASLPNVITLSGTTPPPVYAALGRSGGKAVVWLGYCGGWFYGSADDPPAQNGVRGYRDDGAALTLMKNFSADNRTACTGFDRLAVDPRTEKVFVQDAWNKIYTVEDWKNPKVERCSTTTGPLWGTDMAVGPNGLLYVREGQSYSGPLTLYTMDRKHRLLKTLIADVYSRYGAGYGERGIGVGYDGRIGVLYMEAWTDYLVSLYDSNGTLLKKDFVNPLFMESGGVRFDKADNVYVGGFVRLAGHRYPRYASADQAYINYTGSVMKFPPTGGATDNVGGEGSIPANLRKVYNALTVYPDGFGPFSGTAGGDGCCTCRSPRFDVDGYGRMFIPSALACRIAVTDNNANVIAYVGEYGNNDNRGVFSALPGPAIPLGFPVAAGASEDFIYVSDMSNNRIAQVKMNYALDNIPGLTDHGVGVAQVPTPQRGVATLIAAPNPFTAGSVITCRLPGKARVTLEVFDSRGRMVKRIASGDYSQGAHVFTWNGTGERGEPLSSGLYLYRLTAGNKVLVRSVALAR